MRKCLIMVCTVLILVMLVQVGALASDNYLERKTWNKILGDPATVSYPIVFVHGIAGQVEFWEKTMQTMVGEDYFEMRYFQDDKIYHTYYGRKPLHWVWSVSYYTINPLEESVFGDLTLYAQRLKKMIEIIKNITGQDKVVIVAHSMGGLVARKYMTLDGECWNSVYKILTVGTPNEGVVVSPGIVGQLEDLRAGSEFIKTLQVDWERMAKAGPKKWGVVGGIDTKVPFVNTVDDPNVTDWGGPGFVAISSAIPYGEWEAAVGSNFGKEAANTAHFAFRLAVPSGHMGLLYNEGTFRGIAWILKK